MAISASAYSFAAQIDFDRRSPQLTYSPSTQILNSSPLKPKVSTLSIEHPIEEHEVQKLKNSNLKEIHLTGVFVGSANGNYYVKNYSLSISSQTINPDVEILTLKSCGLTDDHLQGIGELNKLRKVCLEFNHLTEEAASLITRLTGLQSLSVAFNKEINNTALSLFLTMPNLEELDVSHCKLIDEEGGKLILQNSRNIKVNVSHTSMPIRLQREIHAKI